MNYIDPHIHMVSRTTDDYMRMALAGCVCITEPAFWNGFDRGSVDGFRDYFLQLTQYEPKDFHEKTKFQCLYIKQTTQLSGMFNPH